MPDTLLDIQNLKTWFKTDDGLVRAVDGVDLHIDRGETLDLSPEDAARLGVAEGDPVRVTSRRGTLVVPAHLDRGLRAGTVFMTFHFPDQVDVNLLTIDAHDEKSGTAEFKACAVKVEMVRPSGATFVARLLAAISVPAPGRLELTTCGLPGMCLPMWRPSRRA